MCYDPGTKRFCNAQQRPGGNRTMQTYILLLSWTDQGIRAVYQTLKVRYS